MYLPLLVIHNSFRWIAIAFLLFALYRSVRGYLGNEEFSKQDNALRHWTATVLQIQMMIGFVVYFNSPFVHSYWNNQSQEANSGFFAVIHFSLMLTGVIIISIGSALAKRKATDQLKYKTMLLWFCIGLLIILIAVPWPFSPLSQRPYFRFS